MPSVQYDRPKRRTVFQRAHRRVKKKQVPTQTAHCLRFNFYPNNKYANTIKIGERSEGAQKC